MTDFRIGIAGLGTVGAATVDILQTESRLLAARCGRPVVIAGVSARDRSRDRGVILSSIPWYNDPVALAEAPDIDLVVELMGGSEGAALDTVKTALSAGRSVVTANKALIARHGTMLARLAESHGACLNYEAAVAGAIPVIKTLREGLAANRLDSLYGILNGTCNYILSTMRRTGRDFADVLAEAQALGYAEADPTFDIEGIDSAHKLAILASVAFGCEVDFQGIHVEGISRVTAEDLRYGEEMGYRIKLLGIARCDDGMITQRVHPCLVPITAPIAGVEGALNAVVIGSDRAGTTFLEGAGAGGKPTASAVVADILDLARGNRLPTFGTASDRLAPPSTVAMDDHVGAYYIGLTVRDEPGVIADVTAIFRDHAVSLESMLQRGRDPGAPVEVILITHETREASMNAAIALVRALGSMLAPPRVIRIEAL